MLRRVLVYLMIILIGISCQQTKQDTLFQLLSPDRTGLYFNNEIIENDSINIITMEYVYNGGGVVAADFNNDGLCDIFFSGNVVGSKLFLNKGDLNFLDVTGTSKIDDAGRWRSGVAVVDINNDGWKDIYICATISKDSTKRANLLYVNKGPSTDGIPVFEEQAKQFGIDDTGHSSNAVFFDYDNDGDLDLYVLTNTIQSGVPTSYRLKIMDGSALSTDRLYRNNGNGTFENVSKMAGILFEGYGLGISIADINKDGWQDVYVSNDYITNDLLYINNQDGTFKNSIDEYIKHQSQFSMGNDIADINNDGLLDIITLDMLPEGNLRRKTVINGTSYSTYINNKQFNYANQHVRNMLQLNNGNGSFSEIGQLLGVHQTEWSWAPLFADFNNDGFKDLIITNGFPKDVTDKDFSNFRNGAAGAVASPMFLSDSIPVVKVPNQVFMNTNGLNFVNVTKEWGMEIPSFSNGAAYADFDNDGDLDFVVNNINDFPFFFENKLNSITTDSTASGFLRIILESESKNVSGFGTKISMRLADGSRQYFEHSIYRGYLSCVEDVIHIGTGSNRIIDSLLIQWPSGKSQLIRNVRSNQVIKIKEAEANQHINSTYDELIFGNGSKTKLMTDVSKKSGIDKYLHDEKDFVDFNIQRTIPHKLSQLGPGLAVGDVDGNGLDDFFVGGSVSNSGTFYLQREDYTFVESNNFKQQKGLKSEEDQGCLFFDFDNDGDLDLYIVSGGSESQPNTISYEDRFYVNDGQGKFDLRSDLIPKLTSSKSCVRAADFDNDGDLDLFLGTRVIPGKYPLSSSSYLLKNNKGIFQDVTFSSSPELTSAGMVTDALWSDFDNDGWVDLIVVGEFEMIKFYKNNNGKFVLLKNTGIDNEVGWWNSISGADFDQDGDIDYIVGNFGLNNFYNVSAAQPLTIYAKDIDENGSIDAIISCYFKDENGEMKEFPVHFWDELSTQSPVFRRRFSSYHQYGKSEIKDVLTDTERSGSIKYSVTNLQTSYVRNDGDGKFTLLAFPRLTQTAPVNGIVIDDFNEDDLLDVLLIGNDYSTEMFAGPQDSFIGQLLLGDGLGNFSVISTNGSNFFVDGDAKALVRLFGRDEVFYLASQNRGSLKMYIRSRKNASKFFTPLTLDASVVFNFFDGKTQKLELYYGSGYLSQSSRKIQIPLNVKSFTIYSFDGKSRTIDN